MSVSAILSQFTAASTIFSALTIVRQPMDHSANEDGMAAFHVEATGNYPLYYQWQVDSEDLSDGDSATLLINPVTPAHAGNYRVIVSDGIEEVISETVRLTVNPPAPGYAWVHPLDSNILIGALTLDSNDDLYISGDFTGTVAFGGKNFSAGGTNDALIAKLTSDGQVIWSTTSSGIDHSDIYPTSIAVSDGRSSFVAGMFNGKIDLGTQSLTSQGWYDFFLVKFDEDGQSLWGRQAHGADWVIPREIAIDDKGNVYVIGKFRNSVTFGEEVITGSGADPFIAKYNDAGDLKWVKAGSGYGADAIPWGMAVTPSGYTYVAGSFASAEFSFDDISVTRIGGSDTIFLARFDPQGELLWLRAAGGNCSDSGLGIAIDDSGNCYMTGVIGCDAQFGSFEVAGPGLLLAKYNVDGTPEWVTSVVTASRPITGLAITVDPLGQSYVSGVFEGTQQIGDYALKTGVIPNTFVAKFRPGGDPVWAKQVSGATGEPSVSIAVDSSGDIYIPEVFQHSVVFDGQMIRAEEWSSAVAKINASQPPLKIEPATEIVRLTWPVWAEGFILETTSDLNRSENWSPVDSPVTSENHRFFQDVPAADRSGFFRLRRY